MLGPVLLISGAGPTRMSSDQFELPPVRDFVHENTKSLQTINWCDERDKHCCWGSTKTRNLIRNICKNMALVSCPPNSKLHVLSVSCVPSLLNFLWKAPLFLRKAFLFLRNSSMFVRNSTKLVRKRSLFSQSLPFLRKSSISTEQLSICTEHFAICTEELGFYGSPLYLYGTKLIFYGTSVSLVGHRRHWQRNSV